LDPTSFEAAKEFHRADVNLPILDSDALASGRAGTAGADPRLLASEQHRRDAPQRGRS
jgi:hypothetical protein